MSHIECPLAACHKNRSNLLATI